MSNLGEIKDALDVLINSGTSKKNITVLHANTMYPTPMEDVNLNAMLTIQKEFNIAVGYSDHTLGFEVDISAVAMGATTIEKHFTLDKTMSGPDHQASLEPDELKSMVLAIRNTEKALGSAEKIASPSESVNIGIVRKSIIANQKIKKGDLLTDKNITVKRPGTGISPMKWDGVIGSIAIKDFRKDELIEL
jgi:N,N'-diacetyllegionaminate synthase